MSNISADYISEREVLEAIYNRIFDEQQQARRNKRQSGSGAANNNLFLAGIGGHRKEAVQKDIAEKMPRGDTDYIIQTYPREEITGAVRDYYE